MKLTTHHLRTGAALLLAGILLAGCDQSSSDAKHIKVGVINGAEQDVAEVAKKVAKEKYGLDVELVGFSGSLLPNDATNHGELDANVFQHRPFLEQDNQAHGYKLVAVGNTFVFPMAGYSKKIKTVAQIKEGATVAIPNDPTNLGRALLLLQKEKLITLKEGKGLLPIILVICRLWNSRGRSSRAYWMIPKLMWRLSAPLTFSRPGFLRCTTAYLLKIKIRRM